MRTRLPQYYVVHTHESATFWRENGISIIILVLASHAGIFRGARISSLPTNACSTEDNIPFPRLANHVVLSKFWKVDLDRRVT